MSFSWFRVISAQNHLGLVHLSPDDLAHFFNRDTSISGYFSIFNTCSTDTGMMCPIEIEVENGAYGASYCTNKYHNTSREVPGQVVEHQTPEREVGGSILTQVAMLYP